ncbi:MAG: DUF1214 domain-containing protein [Dinoroseobacter sp.]|nr:DUF1214 domain-containing protein [Dinoroseobacter sp.]
MRKTLLTMLASLSPLYALAEDVTAENFARAESDTYFRGVMAATGLGVGVLNHDRAPVTPDTQKVIRANQDTLYSGVVLDLSQPVSFTLPEVDGRFMSMHVVNQDHYMFVEDAPGTYDLTEKNVGTRFALVIVRTFADATNTEDVAKAHAAQDGIVVSGGGSGPFEAPDWNRENLDVIRGALSDVAALGFDASYAFGSAEDTRPVDHLIGAAAGWGGQPKSAAMYVITSVSENDGTVPHVVTARDVPVDAFWSVTVYNAEGYLEANDLGVNSYNNYTAAPNSDGSHTIHFGGCEDGRVNCIPVTPGWNYTVRMYAPREEAQNGSWTFPDPTPVK